MKRHTPRPFAWILMLALGCILAVPSTAVTQRAAVISPDTLPEDMQSLTIQDRYVPVSFPAVGVIHSLDGNVVVVHRADRSAYLGNEGDTVHENDEFYTLPDSRCRLRFTNEDVVSLAPETRFSVDEYSTQKEAGQKTSAFGLVKGKAMFYAMRLFRFKQAKFQVKTPTAVMGVRGTKFGAHVYWLDDQKAEALPIRVADSGRGMGHLLAQAGGGGGTPVTIAACGDGTVIVNGNTLGPGQFFNSYTGTVGYDPGILGGIEGSTGGSGGDGGGGGEGDGGDGGGGDGDGGNMGGFISNITSTQTGDGTAGSSGGEDGGTGQLVHSGYFASLLSMGSDGYYFEDVFLSKTPNLFGTGAFHRADSVSDTDYLIWDGQYTYVTVDDGVGENIAETTTATTLSTGYDYLAYGSWAHTGQTFGSSDYAFVNYSWWVEGLATPESAMATQKGSATYSGEAYGTMSYYGAGSPTTAQLTGSFNTNVNFDTASVQDFTMATSDGGAHSASISGAGGIIGADGTFSLSGGAWAMTNANGAVTVNHNAAYGRFFGPGAEEIGGDWAMKGWDSFLGKDVGAAGIFGGKRSH